MKERIVKKESINGIGFTAEHYWTPEEPPLIVNAYVLREDGSTNFCLIEFQNEHFRHQGEVRNSTTPPSPTAWAVATDEFLFSFPYPKELLPKVEDVLNKVHRLLRKIDESRASGKITWTGKSFIVEEYKEDAREVYNLLLPYCFQYYSLNSGISIAEPKE